MKIILVCLMLVTALGVFSQSTYSNVRYYDKNNSDNNIEWKKIEILKTENQIIINHFGENSKYPISYVYDIISGPTKALLAEEEYTVRMVGMKYLTFTLIVDKHCIEFVTNGSLHNIQSYCITNIGESLK